MNEPTNVSLGEIAISKDPADLLVAYGLGSCVAVSICDPTTGLCGLLHAVLPEGKNSDTCPTKYVESGIETLVQQMETRGASRPHMIVRMAGGANMLQNMALSAKMEIGARNIQAARDTLKRMRLPIRGEQVGGHVGRTVRVYVPSGRTTVRSAGGQEQDLP